MNFTKTNGTPTVKALEQCLPQIIISPLALDKMNLYIDECDQEVGWLGTAVREGKVIKIIDMFLFDQEVSAVTTDITEEGLSSFAEELLKQPDGIDIWNNIKVWGHSHVNMATNPSGTDDDQMDTFVECQHDWFIRIIGNKRGSLRVDLFDYKLGVIYNDMPWVIGYSEEEIHIYNIIVELEKQLDLINTNRLVMITDPIIEEIKTKVKKKQWTYTQVTPSTPMNATNGTNTTGMATAGNVHYLPSTTPDNLIENNEDILSYFDQITLLEIGECETWKEITEILEMYSYDRFFSTPDISKIWAYGKRLIGIEYFGRKDV